MTDENPSPTPLIAARKPMLVRLKQKGERVFWCACGRSKNQPFCDGSHKGTGIAPVPYVAAKDDEEVLFCACKRTGRAPVCDGSHNNLGDKYEEADEEEIAASASTPITPRENGETGIARLDGGAFVITASENDSASREGWRIVSLIDEARGAKHLTSIILGAAPNAAPLSFGNSEAVIFILTGEGEASISDKTFPVAPETALTVRPGEAFQLAPISERITAFATICPHPNEFAIAHDSAAFDATRSDRLRLVDESEKNVMGDRFYQVLADPASGADETTLFIGEIPKSRAAAHRHLYEEAIVILTGEGFVWTENKRAAIRPGDVIFLPRRQLHSLECSSDQGMRLAGAFYPSGSPAINY